MNKLILALVLSCVAATVPRPVHSAETNDVSATVGAVLAEGLKFMAENGWSAADVADAIKSVRGLYVRDNATKAGRERWNGKIVSTTVDTNAMTRTTVYENGRVFVDRFKASSVREANARLTTVVSNGVPARLAAARARRAAEINQGTTNVTVTVTTGK